MAAPMRDTSGGNPPTTANFEYDDNEWDIGIGDLIIDLDADIEKTGVGEGMAAPKPGKMHSPVEHQATVDKGLKMKIKRTKPGTKHEIVKSGENGEKHPNSAKRGSSGHRRDKKHGEKPAQKDVNGVVRSVERVVFPVGPGPPAGVKDKRSEEGPPPSSAPVKKVKAVSSVVQGGQGAPAPGGSASGPPTSGASSATAPPSSPGPPPPGPLTPQGAPQLTLQSPPPQSPLAPPPPPQQQQHLPPPHLQPITAQPLPNNPPQSPQSRDLVDMCVGTSVGTITEPDCLGPCEPGTSVTLEGIVWHETEGVLVVNVTWRGKTYVGTLLDCTRHDWAPPRFCESPTSDLDARTPKGRGKRGRSAANAANDLSNFTETRSSVHSKLRSNNAAGNKGRRGPGAASPTPFVTPKAADTTPGKRKAKPNDEEPAAAKRKLPPPPSTSPLPPPILLECPEPNCSKKYKHINGLKYHQSHAHGSPDDEETKESGTSEEDVQSPLPDSKKEDPPEITPSVVPEEQVPAECEEKTVLRFGSDETPVRAVVPPPAAAAAVVNVVPAPVAAVPTPLVVGTATPPLPLPSPPPMEPPPISPIPPSQPPTLTKVPQFKVKPASALMPDEKKSVSSPTLPASNTSNSNNNKAPTLKKKNRKSPAGSPHPSPLEPPALGIETGREDVQSPAYSDISDDAAPLLESEVEGKPKTTGSGDKKESGQSPQLQHFGMYPFYGQPPYLVPSVTEKTKDSPPEKVEGKPTEKEKPEGSSEYPQKLLPQHYFQYSYPVSNYPYHVEGFVPSGVIDAKKDEKTSSTSTDPKPASAPTLHIPNPSKPKSENGLSKEKHQNENHQILKESIEMKNQMNSPFLYQRQPPPAAPPPPQDDVRRFYIHSERKESAAAKATPPPSKTLPAPSPKHKDKSDEKKERKEDEKKQEGVKPTMETQGPPPPPTSQFAYIHHGYMQSPHYGVPFDPSHPMYRGMNPMLVSSYPNTPYLHPQLHAVPRYHAPEDLSRSQSGKALDLLQHHASQYYSHPSHKIHELQERAIKSPTPKTSAASSSPSGSVPPSVPVTSSSMQVQGKPSGPENKDARSPPPQRHVHTHHHTHVGLGYPILAGQYPAPYGAAVLATEHAAAVTSVPYQAK